MPSAASTAWRCSLSSRDHRLFFSINFHHISTNIIADMSTSSTSNNGQTAPSAAGRSAEWDELHKVLHSTGDAIRRQVVGEEYVNRSLANASDFTMPMQQLATEYAWGGIWSRPGLARRDRSILNIGMLAALGKSTELATHIRGALNNGVTETEVQECLLQVATYVGMPAGMEAFRAADKAVQEWKSNNAAAASKPPQ